MTLTIDHIVIYVQDLEAAMNNYRNAGFTVHYGGQHADGITENGLIIFADGSYLELIALVAGKTYDDAGFKPLVKASGEGYTGYALLSDNLEADIAAMRERGIVVSEIREGQRARPDGAIIQWKMAFLDDAMSPFVIQDLTERDLRVPLTTENTTHANGATGIHELLIRVPDYQEAVERYGKIVGTPLSLHGVARFELGSSAIVLTQADHATMLPSLLTIYADKTDARAITLNSADFMFI